MNEPKPFHEMSLDEYLHTDDAQRVPRNSILALDPDEYTAGGLSRFEQKSLKVLAFLWGVPQGGSKEELVGRILRRKQFRQELGTYSVESLECLTRKQLAAMAKEAGFFYSALRKTQMASQLLAWRKDEQQRAAFEIGKAHHSQWVQKALLRGLNVPASNRERYGFDEKGQIERQLHGVSLSVAIRRAPEVIAAARTRSKHDFLAWAELHPEECGKANFIAPGIIYNRLYFWTLVQKAFEPEPQLQLFG